jgi:hypothetical protein
MVVHAVGAEPRDEGAEELRSRNTRPAGGSTESHRALSKSTRRQSAARQASCEHSGFSVLSGHEGPSKQRPRPRPNEIDCRSSAPSERRQCPIWSIAFVAPVEVGPAEGRNGLQIECTEAEQRSDCAVQRGQGFRGPKDVLKRIRSRRGTGLTSTRTPSVAESLGASSRGVGSCASGMREVMPRLYCTPYRWHESPCAARASHVWRLPRHA